MKLVEELRPFISPDPRSPNRTALSAEKKIGPNTLFLKGYGFNKDDGKCIWRCKKYSFKYYLPSYNLISRPKVYQAT